ncbi:hypothetical protein HMPREF1249_0464 [Jonquetella sp. BV3C21]|nr:hypothetical protein HMPREF1249_0464 [Jonquetella sp. BV3C21]
MYGVGRHDEKNKGVRDHVVASIDGREYKLSELHKAMQGYAERNNIKLTQENLPAVYQQTLDSLATQIALDKAIKERGIEPTEAQVNEQLKQLEVQYVTKEAFLANLRATGSSLEQVKANLAHDLAVRQLLTQESESATVDDQQVKSLYDLFVTMKQPMVYRPSGVEGHHAEFRTKEAAEAFLAAVKAGEDWKTAADKAGDNKIGSTDGKMTSFVSDTDVKERFPFLGTMKDGDYTLQQIADGDFLIFRRVGATTEKTLTFEEAQPQLKALALNQARMVKQQEFLTALKDKVKVEIIDPDVFPKPEAPKKETAAPAADAAKPAAEAPKAEEAKPAEAPAVEAPKAEEAKPAEAPAAEAPKAEEAKPAEAPAVEAPKAEEAKPAEAPAAEAPKAEEAKPATAPAVEAPKAEEPKPTAAPAVEAPKAEEAKPAEAPAVEAPKAEEAKPAEAPAAEAPKAEEAKPAEAPAVEAPKAEEAKPAEAPAVEVPKAGEAKPAEAPAVEAPKAEEAKPAEAPAVEAPKAEEAQPTESK